MIRRHWPLIACVLLLAFGAPLAYSALPPQAMGLVVIGDPNTLGQQASVSAGGALSVNTEGTKATYDSSVNATGAGATVNDMCALPGSASKTIRVLSAELTLAATGAVDVVARLSKRSAAGTGTAGTAMTAVPRDSSSAAASAAPLSWADSSSQVPGAAVGNVSVDFAQVNVVASGVPYPVKKVFAASDNSSALVLRGTAQVLAWNLVGASTPSGLIFACRFVWNEE